MTNIARVFGNFPKNIV